MQRRKCRPIFAWLNPESKNPVHNFLLLLRAKTERVEGVVEEKDEEKEEARSREKRREKPLKERKSEIKRESTWASRTR